jgi:hypothetical protein
MGVAPKLAKESWSHSQGTTNVVMSWVLLTEFLGEMSHPRLKDEGVI